MEPTDLDKRITELEEMVQRLVRENDGLTRALDQANNTAAELRARLYSIGLLLRP